MAGWDMIVRDGDGTDYVRLEEAERHLREMGSIASAAVDSAAKAVDAANSVGWSETALAAVIALSAALTLLLIGSGFFFIVRQQTTAIIERFGRFHRVVGPGLQLKLPVIDQIRERVNLRIQEFTISAETKTRDDVFVKVDVAVQYAVIPDHAKEAFYKLQNVGGQLKSYVFDVLRSMIPTMTLDMVFTEKAKIAQVMEEHLKETMTSFGYSIEQCLIRDVEPAHNVKESMNEIKAAERLREAAKMKGEADMILRVKQAEAEAESAALHGKGIADQRKAIVDGLRKSIEEFGQAVPGASSQEVMRVVVMTQYFDMVKELADQGENKVILIPHSPGGMVSIEEQVRQALLTTT